MRSSMGSIQNRQNAQKSFSLLSKSDIDSCFWINEYVHSGYRPPHYSAFHYLKSIIQWNNETINIWTHLCGFIYFTWLLYLANFHLLPAMNAYQSDYLISTICLLGSQTCMLLSSVYHIFGSVSAYRRRQLLRMDVLGISVGMISVYLMGFYTAFLCFEDWQINYYTLLLGLSPIVIYIPLREDFIDTKVFNSRVGLLHIVFFLISTLGICPTIHWIKLHGGLNNDHVMSWLPNLLFLYIITGFAVFFHASMIPERFKPGAFDVVGCSHQWWHVLILIAMIFWQRSGLDYLALHRIRPHYCLTAHGLQNISTHSYQTFH